MLDLNIFLLTRLFRYCHLLLFLTLFLRAPVSGRCILPWCPVLCLLHFWTNKLIYWLILDPLTLNICSITLWCGQTLYQVLAKPSNPRRSYCDLMTFGTCVTCAPLWSNFHQDWTLSICSILTYNILLLMRCHAVTLAFNP